MLPIHLANLRAYRGPMPKALTNSALRILQDAALSEDLVQTSLVIAWLSADTDFIPTVRTVLERADPESQIANYACMALQVLGDQSDDFARLAEHLAQTKENADWGLNALIGLKNKGLEFLKNWIQSPSNPDYTGRVIRTLYHYAETRKFAVNTSVSRATDSRLFDAIDIRSTTDGATVVESSRRNARPTAGIKDFLSIAIIASRSFFAAV